MIFNFRSQLEVSLFVFTKKKETIFLLLFMKCHIGNFALAQSQKSTPYIGIRIEFEGLEQDTKWINCLQKYVSLRIFFVVIMHIYFLYEFSWICLITHAYLAVYNKIECLFLFSHKS